MMKSRLINQAFFIYDGIVDMHYQYFTDHQVSCSAFGAEGLHFKYLTFKLNLAFFHHWWPNLCCRFLRKSCLDKFIHAFWKVTARQAYLLYHFVIDDVDHNLGNLKNIFITMFSSVISPPA